VLRPISLCRHAVAITPVGPQAGVLSLPTKPVTAAFPIPLLGRLPHHPSFEACSAFTRVTACLLAESPEATLCIEGFGSIVTSTAAPIATGWSDPMPGGNRTH
jgi:hypothetical protein